MYNKAILVGRLGQDPELRYATSGKAVANFSVATSSSKKNDKGGYDEVTEWHRVVVFDKTAENCGKYLAKGKQVFVEGRIQTREWEDKEGNKRYTTEIVADNVKFLSPADGGGTTNDSEDGPSTPFPKDEIPF